jgi:hypothetical protein
MGPSWLVNQARLGARLRPSLHRAETKEARLLALGASTPARHHWVAQETFNHRVSVAIRRLAMAVPQQSVAAEQRAAPRAAQIPRDPVAPWGWAVRAV